MAEVEVDPPGNGHRRRGWMVRYWENVQKKGDDECWPWTGCIDSTGYGITWINGCKWGAHRFSFLIANGKIDPDLLCLHSCNNRWCVNPRHIRQGTYADNAVDTLRSGNFPRGEKIGNSKLKPNQVLDLRKRHSQGESMRFLAKVFGVSFTCVRFAVKRKTWKHLSP